MDSAAEALLIVVSSTLTVFLIVAIIVGIYLIKILDHVKHITEKAEKIADKAEHVSDFVQKSAGSAAVGKMIANIINSVRQGKSSKEEVDEE